MTVVYQTGTDIDLTKLKFSYLQGWQDAAEAVRTFSEHDCFVGKPEFRLVLEMIADALVPGPDKSKMI